MQNHCNLIYCEEEREMNPLCMDQGVGLIPWSRLARGFLEGDRKRDRGEGPTKRAQTDKMQKNMYFDSNDFDIAAAAQKVARNIELRPPKSRVRGFSTLQA